MSTLRTQMAATHRGVAAADEGELHAAIWSVDWEERGLMKRLRRTFREPSGELRRLDAAVEDRAQEAEIAA